MKEALIDTDMLSYYFKQRTEVVNKVEFYLLTKGYLNISLITYYEVLHGFYYRDASSQLTKFEAFLQLHHVVPLSKEVAKTSAKIYADLRKQGLNIGHNDTLIAGTAIVHDMVLITNNTAHYSRIDGLQIDNWSL